MKKKEVPDHAKKLEQLAELLGVPENGKWHKVSFLVVRIPGKESKTSSTGREKSRVEVRGVSVNEGDVYKEPESSGVENTNVRIAGIDSQAIEPADSNGGLEDRSVDTDISR